jgi:hypothetical protein
MSTESSQKITPGEQANSEAWDKHLQAEFTVRSADETLATMVSVPRVNHIPVMTGGDGQKQLHEFYAKHFIPRDDPRLPDRGAGSAR